MSKVKKIIIGFVVVFAVLGVLIVLQESITVNVTSDATVNVTSDATVNTPKNFKVAFIGDSGLGPNAVLVLELIEKEDADMVLHQGDFDYTDNPDAWDKQITDVLGDDFPYFASLGNHETNVLLEYQQKLIERLAKISDASCTGDLGIKSSCTYQGLFFILSGAGTFYSDPNPFIRDELSYILSRVGIFVSDHDTFIRDELSSNNSEWRICSWHKNMEKMQVSYKRDATGWEVYEECRKGGAIIATGHPHTYSRTKTLVSIENQIIDNEWPDPNNVRVAYGSTFVFVSGLGGAPMRDQLRCLPTTYPYGCSDEWASIYTTAQGANFGALFCSFNVDNQPNKAHCYFKDIDGNVPDEFTITSFITKQ